MPMSSLASEIQSVIGSSVERKIFAAHPMSSRIIAP
jgi:hypothetical protein